jgi:hypothetical protein
MGTNYYVRREGLTEPVHLGKSSAGWKFLHRADPAWPREEARERWIELARSGVIESEYGLAESLEELLAFIDSRQRGHCHCVDNGPRLTGPYFQEGQRWHADGYDFTAQEFC